MSPAQHEPEREEPVTITDKRKIDREATAAAASETGAAGAGAAAADSSDPSDSAAGQPIDENAQLLAERTADLQRLQAEYANYRKRSERERLLAGEVAISRVLGDFLPVLDNLDRAKAHGDLTGGLKAVADQLDTVFGKLGLVAFGEVGDPFDPAIHEAVLHDESDAVDSPTCTTVMRPGYKHHDRLIRPAMVGVSDPAQPLDTPTAEAEADPPADEQAQPAQEETAG